VDIETAVEYLTKSIQEAAWSAKPTYEAPHRKNEISTIVKDKIAEKRHLRKQWQLARTEENKRKLNKATKELKNWIQEEQNRGIQEYLESLRSGHPHYQLLKSYLTDRPFLVRQGSDLTYFPYTQAFPKEACLDRYYINKNH
jgi:FMN phosphatase YigB (HAD superfamily)